MQNKFADKVGSVIGRVVGFAKNFSFNDLPVDVIGYSKLILLDTFGALLAASDSKYSVGKILTEFIRNLGGVEESTIIGQGFKSSCVNAAIVNGAMGYYCDIEPTHLEAVVHPPATIVPTCLAVGEREKVNGKGFLLAVVLGIDIDCRISLALNPRILYERGFHPSSIAGSFGAAVAAGRLLNLDPKQFSIALGLAGQQTSGLLAWKEDFTENSRPFNHSIAARDGVTAALLAKMGFGGPPNIFEGKYNIFRAYSKKGEYDLDRLTRGLGTNFLIMEHAFKQYSCCAFLHPGLDALLTIMKEHNLKSTDIEGIVLYFPKSGAELIDGTELRSHSAQYIFSVAALDHQVTIHDILYDQRSETEVSRLVERIEVVADEKLDAGYPERYASIVEVTTTKGDRISERVDYAKGTPENPINRNELEEKFFKLSGQVIEKSTGKEIIDLVDDIENVTDIRELGNLLRVKT